MIMEHHPIPMNLLKVPVLDEYMEEVIKATGKEGKATLDRDKEIAKIQEAVRMTFGPLGRLLETVENWKLAIAEEENGEVSSDAVQYLSDLTQQSVTVLGQAFGKASYIRRCLALNAIPLADSYKGGAKLIKESESILETQKTSLFGEQFATSLETKTKQIKEIAKNMAVKKELKQLGKGASTCATNVKVPFLKALVQSTRDSGANNNSNYQPGAKTQKRKWDQANDRRDGYKGWHSNRGRGKSTSISLPSARACASFFKRNLSVPRSSGGDYWGKSRPISKELGHFVKRPRNQEDSFGVGDPLYRNSQTDISSSEPVPFSSREETNCNRDRIHVEEGSNSTSSSGRERSGDLEYLYPSQEGGKVSHDHKFEKDKPPHSIRPFSDGPPNGFEESFEERRLDGESGSVRCILVDTHTQELEKIHEVHVGGSALRIPGSSFWSGARPQTIYQTNENPDHHTPEASNPDNCIPGRLSLNRELSSGDSNSKGFSYFPFRTARILNKPCQEYFDSVSQLRISGDDRRQFEHDYLSPRGQDRELGSHVPISSDSRDSFSEGTFESDWETVCDSSSSVRSSTPDPSFTADSDPCLERPQELRESSLLRQGSPPRNRMVDNKSIHQQESPNSLRTTSGSPDHGFVHFCVGSPSGGGMTVGDQWSPMERILHINILELKAVELGLKTLLRIYHHLTSIHIRIDNTTALSYLIKMGGTKNPLMNKIAKRIWTFLIEKGITLSASWIPSAENVEADARSRLRPNSSEWLLHKTIFKQVIHRLGHPSIDYFASRTMKQLDCYMSPSPDPDSLGVDAMSHSWEGQFPYLFPPFCLIGRVLRKLRQDKVERAILIAPLWPAQIWFPLLIDQCMETPLRLPRWKILLKNPEGKNHSLVTQKALHLCAFLVTGIDSNARGFRRGLRTSFSMPEDPALHPLTLHPGESGVLGVREGVWIPIEQM